MSTGSLRKSNRPNKGVPPVRFDQAMSLQRTPPTSMPATRDEQVAESSGVTRATCADAYGYEGQSTSAQSAQLRNDLTHPAFSADETTGHALSSVEALGSQSEDRDEGAAVPAPDNVSDLMSSPAVQAAVEQFMVEFRSKLGNIVLQQCEGLGRAEGNSRNVASKVIEQSASAAEINVNARSSVVYSQPAHVAFAPSQYNTYQGSHCLISPHSRVSSSAVSNNCVQFREHGNVNNMTSEQRPQSLPSGSQHVDYGKLIELPKFAGDPLDWPMFER